MLLVTNLAATASGRAVITNVSRRGFLMGAGLVRYILKATFRNKAGYFFSFIFPVVFVVVFGLSLDYQIFILARIREAWQDTGDLHQAVTHAIDRTGRVVTGADCTSGTCQPVAKPASSAVSIPSATTSMPRLRASRLPVPAGTTPMLRSHESL